MRILLAEDDPRLLKALKHILESKQFLVDGVSDGEEALEYAMTNNYDGIVLDIMMPKMDGIEVLKMIRNHNITTPVMFLTAKTEVYQRVEGLDAGADDYLAKPFSTSELLARIRAMLRRKSSYLPDLICCNELILNRSTYVLQYHEQKKQLSGKEFQVMEMMIQQPNCIIPIENFLSHVWGWDSSVNVSVVWVHISNLRKKIDAINAPFEIRYIRSAGYILRERL